MTIFNWQIDTPVDDIIGEAIGAASVCWENPGGAGAFDSERASIIVDEVMAALRQKLWVSDMDPAPHNCTPGRWGRWG